MSAKHTPGPWIAEACSSHKEMSQSTPATVAWVGDYRVRVGIETGVKGGNYRDGLHGDEMADAHLIAAAPEMYEALRDLIAVKPNSDAPEWVAARAAIAKAEGRQ